MAFLERNSASHQHSLGIEIRRQDMSTPGVQTQFPTALTGLLSSCKLLGSILACFQEPQLIQRCPCPVAFLKNDIKYFCIKTRSSTPIFGLVMLLTFSKANHGRRMSPNAFHLLCDFKKLKICDPAPF